ncbi:MAG: IMP 5'-nucleotidase [Vezdaea aestivalis]|nr:MAG: IMP 5'-nucleotidase [Vezdaea aestivalis]
MNSADALKIEWIKGLLAVPFVLHSQPIAVSDDDSVNLTQVTNTNSRYLEIMNDIERLIDDHRFNQDLENPNKTRSKLKLLVPSIGTFFTPLPLGNAFARQDRIRRISSRRFVPPSFNDIRLILNSAQVMALVTPENPSIGLITFDGDLTLYEDGGSLLPNSPIVPLILTLLSRNTAIAIVTAAGYLDASSYHARLHGLLEALASSSISATQKNRLIVLGGESNYLFRFSESAPFRLLPVDRYSWILPSMHIWDSSPHVPVLLDVAQSALETCVKNMALPALVVRKPRAVGIVPNPPSTRLIREQLEETVLAVQSVVEQSSAAQAGIPFCAFNGGNDVFVDIGDKAWGVRACRQIFGGIGPDRCLHVGDQFLSAGANDFKARLVATTAWIAGPEETVDLLGEIIERMEKLRVEMDANRR